MVVLQALRPETIILMGKNTMMKRSIRLYCEETSNDQWAPLLDELVGNVGLVFTKGDLSQVRGWCVGAQQQQQQQQRQRQQV
jgi:large subunit ribosomal protein LP0